MTFKLVYIFLTRRYIFNVTVYISLDGRCYAALGDVSKSRYLHQVNDLIDEISTSTGTDGLHHPTVQAKLAVLEKHFKLAESIYLDQGQVDRAMEMYQELHKWDESLAIAEAKVIFEIFFLN